MLNVVNGLHRKFISCHFQDFTFFTKKSFSKFVDCQKQSLLTECVDIAFLRSLDVELFISEKFRRSPELLVDVVADGQVLLAHAVARVAQLLKAEVCHLLIQKKRI